MSLANALTALLFLQIGTTPAFLSPTPVSLWLDGSVAEGGCDVYLSGFELLARAPTERDCSVVLRLRGVLNIASAKYLSDVADALSASGWSVRSVQLDSAGGDADAAFTMARTLRTHAAFTTGELTTEIDSGPTARCVSACLLLFAAGDRRHAEFYMDETLPSRLGLHRPAQYLRASGQYTIDRSNPAIQAVERRLRRYFPSLGVSVAIVDAMFDVPFEELHLLSREEAIAYRLVTDDAAP